MNNNSSVVVSIMSLVNRKAFHAELIDENKEFADLILRVNRVFGEVLGRGNQWELSRLLRFFASRTSEDESKPYHIH